MDLKEFDYVKAIIEEKNFSKAAKRLLISQPSLSQYINRLEQQLGVTLFDRTTTPVSLTYEGELYVDAMNSVNKTLNELKNKFDDVSGLHRGRLNIGLTPSKATSPLPTILPKFRAQYPDIDLTLTEAVSAELEDMLSKGTIDICMMNTPIKDNHIEYEPLMTENIYLAAPPSEATIYSKNFPSVDLADYDNKPFILLHEDQRLRQVVDGLFRAKGIKPKIVLETRSIVTALMLCDAGLGYCFVPESTARFTTLSKELQYYSIGADACWTLVLAYKQGSFRTKAAKAFADITKQVIGDIK